MPSVELSDDNLRIFTLSTMQLADVESAIRLSIDHYYKLSKNKKISDDQKQAYIRIAKSYEQLYGELDKVFWEEY